ncbi:MAG TPA: ThuA domain-containing protein [Sedimentisphaerales bacterium]|jgi:type 1 glutamine amidotransferase|nr:ThuA domain-containing protein [Sedimentisphaerales bacterium]HNU30090.1 ThuA domain-containing protein [Sedimentisphaerales bacterium]
MRSLKVVTGVAMLAMVFCLGAQPAKPSPIKVLLITGDDVSAHPWREMSETTREILVNSGKFDVKICEDPLILESATALKNYDVIAFLIYSAKLAELPAQAQENLLNYVKGGKGFFVQHLATASFPKWEEFGKLCGRKWIMGTSGHGPRTPFQAKVVDKQHPITAGLSDFEVDDELYAKLQGDAKIQVLVTADSDWSKKTEPLVFVQNYGNGRVVHNAFGHDRKALMTPNVQKIIARGAEWAATGKVTE